MAAKISNQQQAAARLLATIVSEIAPIASQAAEALQQNPDDPAIAKLVEQALLRIGYLADRGRVATGQAAFLGDADAWLVPTFQLEQEEG